MNDCESGPIPGAGDTARSELVCLTLSRTDTVSRQATKGNAGVKIMRAKKEVHKEMWWRLSGAALLMMIWEGFMEGVTPALVHCLMGF